MKTTFLKTILLVALFAGIFSSCVKDDNFDAPTLNACTETTLVKNREVAQILAGSIVKLHENIVAGESDVIEAYVTSSDIGGNFFKSISFQSTDKSKAFSIPVDASSTFINFEPGRKVLIKMDGLYTDVKFEGMRIGGLFGNSSGGAEVGRLSFADFKNSVKRSCTVESEDNIVTKVTIAQAISGGYLNKLIEFENVEFAPNEILNSSTYYDKDLDLGGATNRQIIDVEGNSLIFRTSSYSNFSAKKVQTGSGSIRGILTKYGTDFQFMVRDERDVKLTNPRFSPLLNESFSSGITAWNAYSVTGAEVWTYSASFGNPGACAKMSGYAGGNKVNEDWLISPAQNLSSLTAATLTFDTAYKFSGNALEAFISKDYPGTGDPNTVGTWVALTGYTLSQGNYVWAGSGPLNINAYTGAGSEAVYVGFKYTSTTSGGSTWELDNIKITKN